LLDQVKYNTEHNYFYGCFKSESTLEIRAGIIKVIDGRRDSGKAQLIQFLGGSWIQTYHKTIDVPNTVEKCCLVTFFELPLRQTLPSRNEDIRGIRHQHIWSQCREI
jgi:hypothetical protein